MSTQISKDVMKRHAFKHHIVYIVGCKRLVKMTWDICNDQKYIFKNLQHSLKKWMHTLTFIAKGFENWTILIFYFDNLILSNLKQTIYCLFTSWLFNPRSSKYQFSKCKLMSLMSMPYLYIKKSMWSLLLVMGSHKCIFELYHFSPTEL